MNKNYKITYLIHLRWYSVLNYLCVFGEQVYFWNYSPQWVFWSMLGLNIITMFMLGSKINRLEKKYGLN